MTAGTQSQALVSANSRIIRAQSAAAAIESYLGSLVEISASGLVVAEIAILFGGVISRYVFDRPLVWSDELASTLFLWLAMLGAVIAFRRGEHMRMTACVGMVGGSLRAVLESLATVAALAFLLLMVWPAYQFASDELPITTAALQISDVWRAAALPAGIALMIVLAVLRLARAPSAIAVCLSIGVVAVVVALFWLGAPLFHRLGNLNLLIFFVGVVAATVFAGVPIAFAFGLATFGYLALATHTPLSVLVGRMDEGMSHLDFARRSAVRVPRPSHRNDRHGPRLGWLLGRSRWPCPRRAAFRSGWRHVFGLGNFRLESCRHGGGGASAFPGNEATRRQARRFGRAVVGNRRANRNNSSELGSHHHRLGNGRVDRRTFHRGTFTRRRAGMFVVLCDPLEIPRRGSQQGQPRHHTRDSPQLCSRCPLWRCRF